MIKAHGPDHAYGKKTAVDDVAFTTASREGHRLPGPERRREVHHDDRRAGQCGRSLGRRGLHQTLATGRGYACCWAPRCTSPPWPCWPSPSEHSGDIAPLATVLGLLLVIENLAQVPWKPLQLISPLLPGAAGSKILMTQAQISAISHGSMGAAILGPWQGFAVLLAWVAVLLRHRNA